MGNLITQPILAYLKSESTPWWPINQLSTVVAFRDAAGGQGNSLSQSQLSVPQIRLTRTTLVKAS
jgi:hypothetical protein